MNRTHLKKCGAASLILAISIGMLVLPNVALAAYSASEVLGQNDDFTTDGNGSTDLAIANAYGLSGPYGSVAIDRIHNRLFVGDSVNHRVLEFDLDGNDQVTDHQADHVLGQADFSGHDAGTTQSTFSGPSSVVYDQVNNRLFVSDTGNNRIMVFDVASITDGEPAINVIGQATYATSSLNSLQRTTVSPGGLELDLGNQRLFAGDSGDGRVMVFDVRPSVLIPDDASTDGPDAINVIGQADYTTYGPDIAQNRLFIGPIGVTLRGDGILFVVDGGANRVLVFDVRPSVLIPNDTDTDGPDAVNVIGQDLFTTGDAATSQAGLSGPSAVAFGGSLGNNLFVADSNNNRVMVFDIANNVLIPNDTDTDGPNAINVIGQADYTHADPATTQSGLSSPSGVSLILEGGVYGLFVTDTSNNRILVFDVGPAVLVANDTDTDGPNAIEVLGQVDQNDNPIYTTSSANDLDNSPFVFTADDTMSGPGHVALDAVHHRLFVADEVNSRILEFDMDSANDLNDHSADHVLGQLDFEHTDPALTQSGLYNPTGLAYDPDNDRLFIDDSANNRIMVFDVESITDGEPAINVIGQEDFTTVNDGTTQNLFENPFGIAFDLAGERLFVADSLDNRIMVFDVDPAVLIPNDTDTDGPNAINVIGQADFVHADPALTQKGLHDPIDVAYDATNKRLFVADLQNDRVMVFNADPNVLIANSGPTDNPSAINVIGHGDYVTGGHDTTQDSFFSPAGLTYDTEQDQLFVSDVNNNRIMVFNVDPAVLVPNDSGTDGPDATAVVGQDDFTSSGAGLSDHNLFGPFGLEYDTGNHRLYVADQANNRVMIFNVVKIPDTLPDGGVGVPYDQTISPNNAQGTVSFAVTAGAVPTGLVLDDSTGQLSGTPTVPGSFEFTVVVTDDISPAGAFTDSQSYTVVIGPGPYLASDVLGQLDGTDQPVFTEGGVDNSPNSRGFSPGGIAVDTVHHRLFLVDGLNSRILVFDLDGSDHLIDRIADHVIGQSDFRQSDSGVSADHFSTPLCMTYDSVHDRIFVTDYGNNRVLVFDVSTIVAGESAVNVIGQADFVSGDPATTRNGMRTPRGVTYDSANDRLFVGEQDNNRVVVFDVDPAVLIPNDTDTDGPDAINVIGHQEFDNSDGTNGHYGLGIGGSVVVDVTDQRLFVDDSAGNRIMVFDVDPAVLIPNDTDTDGPDAINVIGQDDFDSHVVGLAADQLDITQIYGNGLAYDEVNKRLFVGDGDNRRVLVFDVDTSVLIPNDSGTDGPPAVNVIGQPDFTSNSDALSQLSTRAAGSLAYDPTTQYLYSSSANDTGQTIPDERVAVWNADPAVLVANDTDTDGPLAIDVLGQLDEHDQPVYTTRGSDDAPNARGMSVPRDVALDAVHHRLFVSDGNTRILEFNLDSDNNLIDHTADHVLGQADFKSTSTGTTQNTFLIPIGLAYDAINDRLFVGDNANGRVMVFDVASITNGENAINVIGHSVYDNGDSPGPQSELGSDVFGLAFDATNERLFVGDQSNNRVMVFDVDPAVLVPNNPLTDGPDAINELGHTAYDGGDTPTDQNGLSDPVGLAYDSTHDLLFVADSAEDEDENPVGRVLVFDVDPAVLIPNNVSTDGPDAIHLLGRTTYDHSDTPTDQNRIVNPFGLAYDTANDLLFVADVPENRVMVFDMHEITDGEDAIAVLGQQDFSATGSGTSQGSLFVPQDLAYDSDNHRLYVVEAGNNRVLIYNFIQLTTSSLPDGTVGEAYDEDFVTTDDQGAVSFSLVSGTLPPGLTIGSLSGTPTTAGDYTFTIRATDNNGALGSFFDDRTYSVTIDGGAPTPTPGGGGSTGGGATPFPPAPSPSPTVSVTPIPSGSPIPSESPSASPEVSVSVSPEPSDSPSPSGSVEPSVIPVPSGEVPSGPGESIGSAIVSGISSAIAAVGAAAQKVLGVVVEQVTPVAAPIVSLAIAIPVILAGVAAAVSSGSPIGFAASQSKVFLEIIGLKRRRRIWGTIYDSRTKRPIPYAKVELYDQNKRLLETRYADRDGRYGFLTSAASLHQGSLTVSLLPSAPKYQFPSALVTKDSDFIVYDHLYHGGSIAITKDSLVNYNIALDPTDPHPIPVRVRAPGILSSLTVTLLDVAFWIGLVLLPLNAFFHPSLITIGFLLLFLISNGIRITSDLYRPYGLTTDTSHHPVPYALVTLNEPNGTRKSFAVSDEQGRYFLVTDPGSYLMTTFTPAQIQPQRTSSVLVKTKKGWIRRGLRV